MQNHYHFTKNFLDFSDFIPTNECENAFNLPHEKLIKN